MAARPIRNLPEKSVIGDRDLIMIIDEDDTGKSKKTTIKAFQKKNLARTVAMNLLLGI